MEIIMLYVLLAVFVLYVILYWVIPAYTALLWIDAEIDVYDLIPFEIILREKVLQKITESKSIHIRKFLDSFIVRSYVFYAMNL